MLKIFEFLHFKKNLYVAWASCPNVIAEAMARTVRGESLEAMAHHLTGYAYETNAAVKQHTFRKVLVDIRIYHLVCKKFLGRNLELLRLIVC